MSKPTCDCWIDKQTDTLRYNDGKVYTIGRLHERLKIQRYRNKNRKPSVVIGDCPLYGGPMVIISSGQRIPLQTTKTTTCITYIYDLPAEEGVQG